MIPHKIILYENAFQKIALTISSWNVVLSLGLALIWLLAARSRR
jgi:hypothetical protein